MKTRNTRMRQWLRYMAYLDRLPVARRSKIAAPRSWVNGRWVK